MRNDKIVVSLCAEGTDTVFALSAGRMLAGCAVQKRPTDPLYALLPKIDAEASVEQVLEFRPDVVLVPAGYDSRRSESLAREGAEVIPVGGDTLEQAYDNLRRIGHVLGRAAEAEKVVTKTEYGFSLLADQVRGTDALRTAFFFSREPYTAAGGQNLVSELLRQQPPGKCLWGYSSRQRLSGSVHPSPDGCATGAAGRLSGGIDRRGCDPHR